MSDNTDDRTVVLSATPAAAKPAGQSHNALPPGTRFFDFEIVGLIGEGGFGIVYLAKDLSLQREVAIKEYMPSSLAVRENDTTTVVVRSDRHSETFEIGRNSFVNEARLLAQFDHPALVKVFQFWEANGTAYMAMPYFQGQTLRDVLKTFKTAPDEAWIRQVLSPVMDALALIHQGNCFHRDIAPDNIMLLADGRPVLLDFGAARRVIGDMTQALTVILKPGYAPVEQYAEIPGVKQGAWTDIYALGAVVYFIITGRTPPPSVGRMMQDNYEPLEKLAAGRYSDTFLRGIDRCLAVKCEDRPQSIAAMREAIGLTGPGSATPPAGTAPASPPATATATPAARPTAAETAARPATASPAPAGAGTARKSGKTPLIIAAAVTATLAAGLAWRLSSTPEPSPSATPAPATTPATPSTPSTPATPAAPAEPVAPTAAATAPTPAPAATPAAPAPAAAPAPVSLDDAIAALASRSDASFGLALEGLTSPAVLGKDVLSFTLRSQREGFVYVLLWDTATGLLQQVFPGGANSANRITPDKPFRLTRQLAAYRAELPQGSWKVLAIQSAVPRDMSVLGLNAGGRSAPATRAVVEARLAAAGVSLAGAPRCTDPAGCPDTYAALSFEVTETEAPAKAAAKAPRAEARDTAGTDGTATDALRESERKYMRDLNKGLDKLLEGR
jgi:serine/threonine protein kinase